MCVGCVGYKAPIKKHTDIKTTLPSPLCRAAKDINGIL